MEIAEPRRGASTEPVPCPRCGARMNRHAEKLVFRGSETDADALADLEGVVVEEFHTCGNCRYVLERRSS